MCYNHKQTHMKEVPTMKNLEICDVTMKLAPEQGITLSFREKIELSKLLDRLGADVIEIEGITDSRVDALRIKSIASAVKTAVVAAPAALDRANAEAVWAALKNAARPRLQVPAAMSVNDCRKIVDTAERTCRHFFMLENCCFDPFALTTMRLADEGRLGDIIHAEGAYIHDISLCEVEPTARHSFRGWMVRAYIEHGGDPYPTHGLGPICLTMNMHRGDRMKSIVSLSATADPAGKSKLNTSIIRTHLGRTIVLSLDVTSPRPYSREMITCGTKGFTRKYPKECIMFAGDTEEEAYRLTDERKQQFRHPVSERWGSEAEKMTVDNEMNYVMDMRLVHCLREGLPMDIDVYDAAEWSAVTELSAISAQKGGVPVEMPDFTHGLWRTAAPHKFFL